MAFLLFFCVIALLVLGYPIAFTLAGVSLIFALIGTLTQTLDASVLHIIPNRIYSILQNEILIAIPLFILMGAILEKSTLASKMMTSVAVLCRGFPGGLGVATVFIGALMAASTGIVGAAVTTMGLMVLPQLLKAGYKPPLACGVVCASGTLGQIIPPSIILILLGDVISSSYQRVQLDKGIYNPEPISIAELFAGALIPGLVLVICYILYLSLYDLIASRRQRSSSSTEPRRLPTHTGRLRACIQLLPPCCLMFCVLGSILFGIATPTEAASVGAIGSCCLAWVFSSQMSFGIVKEAASQTLLISGMVFMILIGATIFSLVFYGLGGEDSVSYLFSFFPQDLGTALLLVMLLMFLLGFVLESLEIIFIVVPIVSPFLLTLGMEPILLGILIALNLQTSFLTPPLGYSLFYLRGVTPKSIATKDIYIGAMPFVIIQLAVVLLVANCPQLAQWLPSYIFG